MGREVDWSKWRRTPYGYVRIPPRACPCGHRWTMSGPGRPRERSVTCTCATDRHHLVWICQTCGLYCAVSCTDVNLWHGHTVPVDLPRDRRAAI